MNIALKNITLKGVLLILAIQILNLSIDAVDFHPVYANNSTANTNFNNINSATEYISEVVLGYTNTFPETAHKLPKQKTTHSLKHTTIKVYEPKPLNFSIEEQFITIVSFAFPLDEKYSFLFSKDITPPPPKA
jgi:hypothetical protein